MLSWFNMVSICALAFCAVVPSIAHAVEQSGLANWQVLPAKVEATTTWADRFLRKHGTRGATYRAIGMLGRQATNDCQAAELVLQRVIDTQVVELGSRAHGRWPRRPGLEATDPNWREFVALGLIVARERYGTQLSQKTIEAINVAIARAAAGTARRKVPASYTNIALMSILLLDDAGDALANPWADQARRQADAMGELFDRHGTFTEFNSPTYYGVDLVALAALREFAKTPEIRDLGERLEAALWHEVAEHYHPGLRNLCGPYSRAYGMDMTAYPALVGLAIAVVQSENGSQPDHRWPTPAGTSFRPGEWAYLPLMDSIGFAPPAAVTQKLTRFEGPRTAERSIDAYNSTVSIQTRLEANWMMGAAAGLQNPWQQHCVGTLHWRTGEAEQIGWLLVDGAAGASAQLAPSGGRTGAMEIHWPATADGDRRLLVNAPQLTAKQLEANVWHLPGMTIQVDTAMPPAEVRPVDHPHHGKAMEVVWRADADQQTSVELKIRPTGT